MVLLFVAKLSIGRVEKKFEIDIHLDATFDSVSAVNIMVTAYGFAINFYPLYDKLEPGQRTHKNMLLATTNGLGIASTSYCLLIWFSTSLFGLKHIH